MLLSLLYQLHILWLYEAAINSRRCFQVRLFYFALYFHLRDCPKFLIILEVLQILGSYFPFFLEMRTQWVLIIL